MTPASRKEQAEGPIRPEERREPSFDPDWRVHPGELLSEVFDDFGLSRALAAKALGVTPQYVTDICKGRRGISPKMASRIGSLFGPTAQFWMRLQAFYDDPLPSERRD